ncbi:heat shock protein 70 [Firespike leaf roll-associated virus]|nr:heat shock protein 70 [Firespike leaf roll-associated virus]
MDCGIDFGTTFSTLCFSPGRKVEGCVEESESVYIPTAVGVRKDMSFCIGRAAIADPEVDLYRDIKRWVGCNHLNEKYYRKKLKPTYKVVVKGMNVSLGPVRGREDRLIGVVDLIYIFIKGLVTLAFRQTTLNCKLCTCSVPADYNSYKRSYVFEACDALGIGVQAVVNEPTAAGLSSFVELGKQEAPWLLVYDFGGGTFDVSMLATSKGSLCVRDSLGDNYLGGRDVDNAVRHFIAQKTGVDIELIDPFSMEDVKIRVCSNEPKEVHSILLTDGRVQQVILTYEELRNICKPFVRRAARLVEKVIKRNKAPSVAVVLIGGSCVLPGVRESVASISGVFHVVFSKDTYRGAVAIGAALYAQSFTQDTRFRLLDCASATLSDERRPIRAIVVLPKGHPIPTKLESDFKVPDYPTAIVLHEGESPVISWNERTFSADVPKGMFPARSTQKMVMKISEDGRLEVTLGGKVLKNLMVIAPVSNDAKRNLRFRDFGDKHRGEMVQRYQKAWASSGFPRVLTLQASERNRVYQEQLKGDGF